MLGNLVSALFPLLSVDIGDRLLRWATLRVSPAETSQAAAGAAGPWRAGAL
jgi:hypothetical protein